MASVFAHIRIGHSVRSQVRLFWMAALVLFTTLAPMSLCRGESDTADFSAQDRLKRGTIEVGAAVGYWQAVSAPFHAYSANRSAVFIMPRIGMILTDELKAGMLSGNLEVFFEPVFAQFTKPISAQLAGGSVVLKYNFGSFGRWVPFWEAGAGLVWMNLIFPNLPEESEPVNFLLQTGPGVQYLLTRHVSLTAGVRWSHISNADIAEKNAGLNAVMPYVGLSWFLP